MSILPLGSPATISDLRAMNQRAGYHFFERSTMRFFNSRVERNVKMCDRGWLFITSEQYERQARKWTLRLMTPDGDTKTIGGFQAHATKRNALAAMQVELGPSEQA